MFRVDNKNSMIENSYFYDNLITVELILSFDTKLNFFIKNSGMAYLESRNSNITFTGCFIKNFASDVKCL